MEKYDPKKIEPKWQKRWEEDKSFCADDNSTKKKYYCLIEFPYPSGDGMHVGHIRSNTAMDIIARKRRMEGYEVLYPIGWDAFGLPTENYAIKTKTQPAIVTKKNTDNFRKQLKSLGFSFDWSREVNTTDPTYYKWTQWIFLQMYKKGLAYKAKMPINWCLSCKIGLANEEVVNGRCERCGGPTDRREKSQWMLAITKYADRLIDDLKDVDFLEKIKTLEKNWIGRSEGHEVKFSICNSQFSIDVFTTRLDTIYGATYLVLSPEHTLIKNIESEIENLEAVREYQQNARCKTEIERTEADREKTGVELKGIKAINPANGKKIPVWISDYVIATYGTGAIMAVPAHDDRDREFAEKFGLPIIDVIEPMVTKIGGDDKFRNEEKTSERRAVVAIIKHWSEDKYLAAKWLKTGWQGFVIGGIESGEEIGEAGIREIVEETGYMNPKFVKKLGGTIHARFWQSVKNENRVAHFEPALFELIDGAIKEPTEEEKKLHQFSWLTKEEMCAFITHDDMAIAWNRVYEGQCKPNPECERSGILINSEACNGLTTREATGKLEELPEIKPKTTFKLRDWVFSRQRYWGEPIPVIQCLLCGEMPVGEDELPVTLPPVDNYMPTDSGESPLANIEEWVNTICPSCGGPAKRETDTMPNWAGSSWYWLRYTDAHNEEKFADTNKLQAWTPVDWYNGGMEHVTLHLLYARFWNKFLYDEGLVPTVEPFIKRTTHGMVLAENGVKMSKSKGNVVNPDSLVEAFGADSVRLYEMFMGPFDQEIAWNTSSIAGVRRFIERLWKLQEKIDLKSEVEMPDDTRVLIEQTIKKVGEDIEEMKFNTAISTLMILVNKLEKLQTMPKHEFEKLVLIVSPFIPHVGEELWSRLGNKDYTHKELWPVFDTSKLETNNIIISVQVNGKFRATLSAKRGDSEQIVRDKACMSENVYKWISGKEIMKVIYVKDKLINILTQ